MKRQGDQVSINVFEIIDEICREFRKDWKANGKADISRYLNRVDEAAVANLFRNLLSNEIRFRFKSGQSPTSSEYVKRFPQFAQIIRQEFDESTMGSFELAEGTPVDSAGTAAVEPSSELDSEVDQTRTFEELAASRLGDYELIRELGRGGFGVVYEARHVKQQNRVALKTLPTGTDGQEVNADRLHKFRKEFRTLSEINHPNLVGMQTLEFDGTQWFFTMDLVKGTDFLSYVRPKDWLDEKHLRASIKQLAAGIMALHDKGIVHRDLKPSNVLVEPNGRVVILDFGLVAQLQQHPDMTATKSAMFAGTPRYAAPEQMFGQRSEASDWYAMGVMLYEALTGAPPFPGRNPMEVLQQKQNEDPPTLSTRDDIPSDLATLADALLRRESSQRATTSHIAHELELDLESTKHPSVGSTDDEGVELETFPDEEIELIGREEQLAQLETAKQQLLETRKPVICWITGLSGEGKSALLDKFLLPMRKDKSVMVLSGRCYDRESVPFKGVDCLIDPLVYRLRSLSNSDLAKIVPDDIHILARVFPVLRRLDHIAAPQKYMNETDELKIRNRAFNAFRKLLANISKNKLIVLCVDDLQWGDFDSADVFFELMANPNLSGIMLIGSYRRDESGDSAFLNRWQNLKTRNKLTIKEVSIDLSPLNKTQCTELVLSELGTRENLETLAANLYESSGGNPYLIKQLVDSVDEESDESKLIKLETSIDRKLTRCSPDARSLINVIAASGKSLPVEFAIKIAQLGADSIGTITQLRNEHLIRTVVTENQQLVDTYHDKIREATLAGLSNLERNTIHSVFAKSIEAELGTAEMTIDQIFSSDIDLDQKTVADLAFHYSQADNDRAFPYHLLASERALNAFAVNNAIEHGTKAASCMPSNTSEEIQYRLSMVLGSAYWRSGKSDLSHVNYMRSLRLAKDTYQLKETLFRLAYVEGSRSNFAKCFELLDQLFVEAKTRIPGGFLTCGTDLVKSLFLIAFWPYRWQAKRDPKQIAHAYLISEAFLLRSVIGMHFGNLKIWELLASMVRILRHAVQTGQLSMMKTAAAKSRYGVAAFGSPSLSGIFDLLVPKYIRETEEFDLEGNAYWTISEAVLNVCRGNLLLAHQDFIRAGDLFENCGIYAWRSGTLELGRHVRAFIDSTSSEFELSQKVKESSEKGSFADGVCWGYFGAANALARQGKLSKALQQIVAAAEIFGDTDDKLVSRSVGLVAYAYVWLQASNNEKANSKALESWNLVKEKKFYFLWAVQALPILIEAMAGPEWTTSGSLSTEKRRTLKKHLTSSWWAYRFFSVLRCVIQRSRGRAFYILGQKKRAIRCFEQAIANAQTLQTDYDLARCLLDLAAVKEEGRDENRAEAIELLKKMESVIPRAESWLLGDQYDEAVVAPEFDLAAWEKENGPVTPYLNLLEKSE